MKKNKIKIYHELSSKKLIFIDENDFNKKYHSLKKYCPKAHKYLMFDILSKYNFNEQEGKHIEKLPTSKEFKAVYGQIKLVYTRKNDVVTIENIEPAKFLIDGYRSELDSYKGLPYRDKKDKFKIDLIAKMKVSDER